MSVYLLCVEEISFCASRKDLPGQPSHNKLIINVCIKASVPFLHHSLYTYTAICSLSIYSQDIVNTFRVVSKHMKMQALYIPHLCSKKRILNELFLIL